MGLLSISVLRPGAGPRAPPGPGLTPCGSPLKEQNHQQHRLRDLPPQRGLKQQRLDGDIKHSEVKMSSHSVQEHFITVESLMMFVQFVLSDSHQVP